jgi:Spy/CpxP family protein refolding chaperone
MKIIIATLLAAVTLNSTADAQIQRSRDGHKGRHERIHGEGKEFKQKRSDAISQLNLSDDQRNKMKSINEDFRTKMKDLRSNENITIKEAKERKHALINDHKAQIQSVLTAEQKSKLEQTKAEAKDKSKRGGKFGKDKKFNNYEKLQAELNLTDAQIAQLKLKREEAKASFKSVKEDQTLTKEQREAKLRQLREENKNSFKQVLTSEQQSKLEEIMKSRKN